MENIDLIINECENHESIHIICKVIELVQKKCTGDRGTNSS